METTIETAPKTAYPKIKRDLQFFLIDAGMYHVFDPTTARHFRMGHQEVSWLKLLDGSRTKDALRDFIPHEYFERFLSTTERLALLEGQTQSKKRDLFKITFPIFNPNSYLTGLGRLPDLYRILLNRLAIFLLIVNIAGLARIGAAATKSLDSIHFSPALALYYLAAILVIGFCHEMSHALVARSLGVNVPTLGLMLFYFHPSFFADVSGLRLLPKRESRINILLAGVMANNVLISIGLFLYCLLPEVATYTVYFIWMNAIILLVNLIPFVEYDGHYILQELLSEPDLSSRSAKSIVEPMPRRPEHLVYYVLSKAFSLALILSPLLMLRRYALRMAQPAYVDCIAVLLLITVTVLFFRRGNSSKLARP